MQAARIWAVLLGFTAMATAPVAGEPRRVAKKTDTSTAAARQYAENLFGFVKQVEGQYVRVVPDDELFSAALTGLYEAAKEPMPANVRNEIARIGDLSRKLRWVAFPTAILNWCAQPPNPNPHVVNPWTVYIQSLTRLIAPFDRLPHPRWFAPWAALGLGVCDIPRGEWQHVLMQARKSLGTSSAFSDSGDLILSIRSLSRVLDPYTGLTTPNEFTNSDENQARTGIDFENLPPPVMLDDGDRLRIPAKLREPGHTVPSALIVKSVVPGGPGQAIGMRPGDVVEQINDRPIKEMNWPQIYQTFYPTMRATGGEGWADQRLTIRRPGREGTRVAALRAEQFRTESVFGMRRRGDGSWDHQISPSDSLAYARIGAIGNNTHAEVFALSEQMTRQGHQGLLLDLRWCPGGFLTPAQVIALSLLNESKGENRVVVRLQYRDRREETQNDIDNGRIPHLPNLPIVVLINNDTRGGGEMIAAALQDYHRAVVVGERSFGKASIQKPLEPNPLRHLSQNGSDFAYRITVGTFLRPNGKNLQRFPNHTSKDDWGVQPDSGRLIPLSSALSDQLKTWWTWHILRPAGSSDALPTDDPDVDPQLTAAIQMLKQMVAKAKS